MEEGDNFPSYCHHFRLPLVESAILYKNDRVFCENRRLHTFGGNVFVHSCVNQRWMLFFWTKSSQVANYLLEWSPPSDDENKVIWGGGNRWQLSLMYAVQTPKHEDTTVFENDWTNTWSLINFRLFFPSPKKSHARFMMSSLWRTKGFIAVSIRLFTGSSVKREWSFSLFWAPNPHSQGTMPTGI